MGLSQPTDKGRPKEVAAARALNYVMFALIVLAIAAFSGWNTYREFVLIIDGHGMKLGDHLQHMLSATQPFILFAALWISLRRKPRSVQAGK